VLTETQLDLEPEIPDGEFEAGEDYVLDWE
jgi:hypothetical protein